MYRMDELENYGVDEGFYQREARKSRRPEEGELEERKLEDNIRHSGFYHRMFEGYREELVSTGNGKHKKIARIYVGDYYRKKCGRSRWLLGKVVYLLLYLLAAAAYLFALTRPIKANTVWYVAAPGLLSVIPMGLVFVKLMACIAAKRIMVIYDYKYVFQRLFPLCTVTAGFLCVTSLMMLLSWILDLRTVLWNTLVPCASCLLGAGLIFMIGALERRAEYEQIKNPNAHYVGGVEM
jgi:hypothetical protein